MSSTVSVTPETKRCSECGTPLSADLEKCPECGRDLHPAKARLTLAVVILVILLGFAFTQSIVVGHREKEQALARSWFLRGQRAMTAGYPPVATEDYRTAIYYDRAEDIYRLRLAESLLAQAPSNDPRSHFITEARSHLVALWDTTPADGEINLELARLYVKEGDPAEAVRFYRNAINGVWSDDPLEQRVAARFELIHYLLAQRDLRQAEAELIALQADSPPDVEHRLQLAELLLQVNEPTRAASVFASVRQSDPENLEALIGAGRASLDLGDYREAERSLAAAADRETGSGPAHRWHELAREIVRIDPGLRGLSISERAVRAAAAYRAAVDRLTACAAKNGYVLAVAPTATDGKVSAPATLANAGTSKTGAATGAPNTGATAKAAQPNPTPSTSASAAGSAPPAFANLYSRGQQLKANATEATLRQNPDLIEPTMDFVFDVQRALEPVCPATTPVDEALLLLARHEGEDEH